MVEQSLPVHLPFSQRGPENIQITAFAIALKQVAIPENKACIQQMKKTQVLALALLRRKCRLVTGVVVGSHSFGLNWDTGGDNPRLYRPHKEFVKSLCEIRNRVEAFALQYEMHASSYHRDIATAQQVSKTSGAPAIGCLTVLPAAITTRPMVWHYDSDCGFNYSYATKSSVPRMVGNMVYGGSPVSAALSVGRREFYALFIEEGLDWSSIPWKKEAMKSFEKVIKLAEKKGYGLTRSVGSSSRRDIFLVAQDQEICFGDVSLRMNF
ncbi:hypothetical protein DY000_02033143 [Brassica cretica]|uniref:Glycine hydroxymethyltransferase n=1 Tax=Brassica cretica TaxID=69181 RepID=A0ABQ7DHU8_BRACR|nr:hypothetical protein DY000_02033143 [Brassica cretica]